MRQAKLIYHDLLPMPSLTLPFLVKDQRESINKKPELEAISPLMVADSVFRREIQDKFIASVVVRYGSSAARVPLVPITVLWPLSPMSVHFFILSWRTWRIERVV